MANNRINRVWPILQTGVTEVAEHVDDPFRLYSSDHPGLSLVTSQLTGNNYLSWRRAMLIALGAKTKLGFIDGKIDVPEEDSPKYDQWRKVDSIVISWILNSISKDLVDAFIYSNSAKELWDDIAKRFGDCNGPMIYQLERDIANMNQRNIFVVEYFTKLKKLWDELACLMPLPICKNETRRLIVEREMNRRLMQFLMGLQESYDQVRSQLLLMDPLPDVDKAYSMVLRVEKQRNIHLIYPDNSDTVAMSTRINTFGRRGIGRGMIDWNADKRSASNALNNGRGRGYLRRSKEEKAKLVCEHCSMTGHEISECFKLHGYPDWFKQLREDRGRMMANSATEDFQKVGSVDIRKDGSHFDIASMVQQEVSKILAGKDLQTEELKAMGKAVGSLYVFCPSSHIAATSHIPHTLPPDNFILQWHRRLAHASSTVLKHLDFLNRLDIDSVNKSLDQCDTSSSPSMALTSAAGLPTGNVHPIPTFPY
ncbi:hypothetical protein DH2020_015296 [Rehmannia glutinosa]|uniref:Retrotransposon Copia-like N-terminal domain-containing protein n=1 Tax=Rehmannia glutinosa TaxID=99300 RepID=A0ABR0WVU8_REHGL